MFSYGESLSVSLAVSVDEPCDGDQGKGFDHCKGLVSHPGRGREWLCGKFVIILIKLAGFWFSIVYTQFSHDLSAFASFRLVRKVQILEGLIRDLFEERMFRYQVVSGSWHVPIVSCYCA